MEYRCCNLVPRMCSLEPSTTAPFFLLYYMKQNNIQSSTPCSHPPRHFFIMMSCTGCLGTSMRVMSSTSGRKKRIGLDRL